ncbi:MAG: ACT domain-containing protein [Planctomycetota bacterium]
MARRFITVDDLVRLNAREVVLDADTIVTPQALDHARAQGITLRTSGGGYAEPVPDRGPDAERAARSLPHLPEPEPDLGPGIVVTAVGKNRAGVLAEITNAVAHAQGNVMDISQKMVAGYFHLVITVELPQGADFAHIKQHLECLGGQDDYVVRVMHERVFRFMHRV